MRKKTEMDYDDDLFTPEGNQPVEQNADSESSSAGKKKSGCGIKFFLILLIAFGGLMLLCCGGIGLTVYSMKPEIEKDPAIVKQKLSRMLKIDLPEGFEAKNSFKMNMFSFILMDAIFIENSDSGVIILMEFSGTMAENKELQASFKEGLGNSNSSDELNIEEQVTREVTIDGQTIKFNFIKGTDRESQQEIRQIHGILPGKKGPILFIMSVSEETWDEEQALKMLESIEIPKD